MPRAALCDEGGVRWGGTCGTVLASMPPDVFGFERRAGVKKVFAQSIFEGELWLRRNLSIASHRPGNRLGA